MTLTRRALAACAALLGCALAAPVLAQADFPNRPIRIVVPYAAGGGADQVARLIGQRLGERLKQTIVVDNRGGASNTIGMNMVARAPADGYTLGLATPTFLMTPSLIKDHPYDPIKDFTAVAMLGDAPLVLAVHPSVPAKDIREFVSYAKSQPGKMNWASGGTASTQGLAGLMFAAAADIKTEQIQYKGSSQGMTDLLGGQVQYMFNPLPSVIQHVKTGKLRLLGVASTERLSTHPELPAIAETVPGFSAAGWFALVAPAATPRAIVERLNREISDIVNSPDIRERMIESGLEPRVLSTDAFGKLMGSDFVKYARIFTEQNLKPQ